MTNKSLQRTEKEAYCFRGIFLVDFSEDFSFWKFITVIFNSLFIVLHITISNLEKLTVSLKHIIKEHV